MPAHDLEKAEDVARRRWALEQRLNRVSYREIAETLGVNINTVRNWVRQETTVCLPQEEREELIAQEMASIDRDENRANKIVEVLARTAMEAERIGRMSDAHAAATELRHWQGEIRKLRLQRTNLRGLNAPLRVQHNLTVRTEFDEELELLAAELTGGGNLMSGPEDVLVDDETIA